MKYLRFDRVKKADWFNDSLVREIIEKIDNARVELGFSVVSKIIGDGYSVNDLSAGAKTLIMMYMCRDKVMLGTFGDNCTDFVERCAFRYGIIGKSEVSIMPRACLKTIKLTKPGCMQ